MSLRLTSLILLFSIFLSCTDKKNNSTTPDIVKDDLGNNFTFSVPPTRIISLAPNLTEFIYDIGIEKYLVGNTIFCDYPEDAKKVEKVGDLLTFNFEKILQLKPDLLFITVEGNTKETYDKFRELGLKVFVSNPRGFDGIKKTYSDLSKIFRLEEKAKTRIAGWDSIVAEIKTRATSFKTSTMLCAIELKPTIAAGKNTFINEILEICGGKNITDGLVQNYPLLSREKILESNPDYFLYISDPLESINIIIEAYPEWKSLKAVKNKKVLILDRNLFGRPGPRFVDAVKVLFSQLHPAE